MDALKSTELFIFVFGQQGKGLGRKKLLVINIFIIQTLLPLKTPAQA